MVSIPDRLQALITSRPTEKERTIQIEIPKELVERATVDLGDVYQITVLNAETGTQRITTAKQRHILTLQGLPRW